MGRVHRKTIVPKLAPPAVTARARCGIPAEGPDGPALAAHWPAAALACGLILGPALQARQAIAADPAGADLPPALTADPAPVRLPMMEVTGSAGTGPSALPDAY